MYVTSNLVLTSWLPLLNTRWVYTYPPSCVWRYNRMVFSILFSFLYGYSLFHPICYVISPLHIHLKTFDSFRTVRSKPYHWKRPACIYCGSYHILACGYVLDSCSDWIQRADGEALTPASHRILISFVASSSHSCNPFRKSSCYKLIILHIVPCS